MRQNVKYLVAHNRDRDSYQVPLALAEHGLLERFVTDYYAGGSRHLPTLGHRQVDGLPRDKTVSTYSAVALQAWWQAWRKLNHHATMPRQLTEGLISRRLARLAVRRRDCGIFAYSDFALEAFRATTRPRVLFKFHPEAQAIRRIMREDREQFAQLPLRPEPEELRHDLQQQSAAEIELADAIVCASTFTRATIQEVHGAGAPIHVVPYGTPRVDRQRARKSRRRCQFLFVGQGVQRKGLHHLLTVWADMRPRPGRLTLVISNEDPAISRLASEDVVVRRGLSQDELYDLMSDSDVLLLPSLVEGFGLVLGEALATGCHLIATTHTGLVDMDLPDWAATILRPGDLAGLGMALDATQSLCASQPSLGESIKELAGTRSWEAFRNQVAEIARNASRVGKDPENA